MAAAGMTVLLPSSTRQPSTPPPSSFPLSPLPRPPALQELCNGGSWYDRLAAKGVFPEAKAADVTRVLLRAVHQCHSLGVVHRCG